MSGANHPTPEKRFDPWLAVAVSAYVGFVVLMLAFLIRSALHAQ